MKLETFLEKFDQFADAPDAVAKMREIVLDLAVRGRLFGKAVEGEADRLPNGWHQRQLGEVAQFINGDRSKNYPSKSFRVDDGVPFINAGHLSNGDVELSEMDYITPEHFDRLGGGKVEPGDVLYCLRGSLGKCAVVQSIKRGAIASSLLIIRPSQQVASRFIYLFFTSPLGARMIAKYDNGSAQPNLSAANVKKYIVPLPPLAEQKRIVAKVDELMALCDRLEAQQLARETRHAALARASLARFAGAPTPANLNFLFHSSFTIHPSTLRKSILTLAVQGKLVPQDPNDEPAEELVARVAAEKLRLVQAKEIKTETPLDPISDEEVFPIPHSWIWLRAGELCRPISSGSTPDQSVFHSSDGVPYLKVYNIRNQTVEFDYKRQFIAANHHEERMKRSILRPGDVIMNIVGPPLGKVAIVPDTFPEWNCNQAISFFRPIFPEFAPYLYTFLKEGSFLQNIQLIGTAGQDNISVTKCKFIPVPIPPLAEQRRIVAKVEQLMALVDALETQLAASRATAANLLSALVTELTAG